MDRLTRLAPLCTPPPFPRATVFVRDTPRKVGILWSLARLDRLEAELDVFAAAHRVAAGLIRRQLIDAAYRLFGEGGEAAVSVRSVCRSCGLNTRYFYESFADTDDLLGAVYDQVSAQLGAEVEAAMAQAGDSLRARTRAGIAAVLGFSSADPRRGRVLFTDARSNPVLAARRAATQDLLREGVLTEGWRLHPDSDPVAAQVGAAMYTGAMAELAQQWLAGRLGTDLDVVVDHALRQVLR